MSGRPMVFASLRLVPDGRELMVNVYAVTAVLEGEQSDLTRVFVEGSDEPFKVMGTASYVLMQLYEAAGPMAEFGGHG